MLAHRRYYAQPHQGQSQAQSTPSLAATDRKMESVATSSTFASSSSSSSSPGSPRNGDGSPRHPLNPSSAQHDHRHHLPHSPYSRHQQQQQHQHHGCGANNSNHHNNPNPNECDNCRYCRRRRRYLRGTIMLRLACKPHIWILCLIVFVIATYSSVLLSSSSTSMPMSSSWYDTATIASASSSSSSSLALSLLSSALPTPLQQSRSQQHAAPIIVTHNDRTRMDGVEHNDKEHFQQREMDELQQLPLKQDQQAMDDDKSKEEDDVQENSIGSIFVGRDRDDGHKDQQRQQPAVPLGVTNADPNLSIPLSDNSSDAVHHVIAYGSNDITANAIATSRQQIRRRLPSPPPAIASRDRCSGPEFANTPFPYHQCPLHTDPTGAQETFVAFSHTSHTTCALCHQSPWTTFLDAVLRHLPTILDASCRDLLMYSASLGTQRQHTLKFTRRLLQPSRPDDAAEIAATGQCILLFVLAEPSFSSSFNNNTVVAVDEHNSTNTSTDDANRRLNAAANTAMTANIAIPSQQDALSDWIPLATDTQHGILVMRSRSDPSALRIPIPRDILPFPKTMRRNVKLIKMHGPMLFQGLTNRLMWIDNKLARNVDRATWLQFWHNAVTQHGVCAAFWALPFHPYIVGQSAMHNNNKGPRRTTLQAHCQVVQTAVRHDGPGVTDSTTAVRDQCQFYLDEQQHQQKQKVKNASSTSMTLDDGLIDSAMMAWDLSSNACTAFNADLGCTWSDEIHCGSDRDQISFPFALQHMAADDDGQWILDIPVRTAIDLMYRDQRLLLPMHKWLSYWSNNNNSNDDHHNNNDSATVAATTPATKPVVALLRTQCHWYHGARGLECIAYGNRFENGNSNSHKNNHNNNSQSQVQHYWIAAVVWGRYTQFPMSDVVQHVVTPLTRLHPGHSVDLFVILQDDRHHDDGQNDIDPWLLYNHHGGNSMKGNSMEERIHQLLSRKAFTAAGAILQSTRIWLSMKQHNNITTTTTSSSSNDDVDGVLATISEKLLNDILLSEKRNKMTYDYILWLRDGAQWQDDLVWNNVTMGAAAKITTSMTSNSSSTDNNRQIILQKQQRPHMYGRTHIGRPGVLDDQILLIERSHISKQQKQSSSSSSSLLSFLTSMEPPDPAGCNSGGSSSSESLLSQKLIPACRRSDALRHLLRKHRLRFHRVSTVGS